MKETSVKRAVCLFLTVLTVISSLLTFTSCNRSYDEDEVVSAAEELLRKAEILNNVYYGRGIGYVSGGYENGYYKEADLIHLSRLGFETIDDLKNLTRGTFTSSYSEQIFSTKLESIADDDGIREMARYYQHYDIDTVTPICIMVYTAAKVSFTDELSYDYSTLRVTGVKRQTVFVTVTATVTNSDGESQTVDIELDLIEEDYGWRIDNPCYANYNPSLDRYEELEKEDIK